VVKFASSVALFFVALTVSGCKDEEPNRSVDNYLNYVDERIEMIEKCEAMDGASLEANCVNAQKASEIQASKTNKEDRSDAVNSLFGSEN
jgi:CRISPR/Cas system-associated protein Cas7 (RAMP superfamily)